MTPDTRLAAGTAAASPATISGAVRPRDDIALMDGYHSPQLDVAVRLNTNESPLPPPGAFIDAVAAAARTVAWNRYPDRQARELRRCIAARHGVTEERVFAANGSNEVLQCLLLAYGGAGRTAAVFEPTYAVHSHLIRITGTALVEGERSDDFTLDPALAADTVAAARPAVTFLCSPDNPTGTVAPVATVTALVEAVRSVGGLLCVDEAYGEFAPQSALDLVDDDTPLAVTRTYSKTWAMAAARLGYLVGPRWLVAELEKVALPYHLDAMKQAVGIVALDYAEAMRSRVDAIVAERARLAARLAELPVDTWPSGANFVLIRPRPRPGAEVWRQLVDRSVLVRDCSSWPRLAGCLRVTVGTPDEDDRFLVALAEILA